MIETCTKVTTCFLLPSKDFSTLRVTSFRISSYPA